MNHKFHYKIVVKFQFQAVSSPLFRRMHSPGRIKKALLAMGNVNLGHDRPAMRRVAREGFFIEPTLANPAAFFMEGTAGRNGGVTS